MGDKLSNSLEWRLEENNVFRPDFGDSSFTEVEDPSGSRIVVVTPGTLDNLPPRLGPPPVSISPGPSQLPVVVKPQAKVHSGAVRFQEPPRLPKTLETNQRNRQVRFPDK